MTIPTPDLAGERNERVGLAFQIGIAVTAYPPEIHASRSGNAGPSGATESASKDRRPHRLTSLSDTKQIRIKAFVKHLERMGKEAGPPTKTEDTFTVGMTVPSSIVLFALPEDAVTDVPQVTSYRFFVAENGIIVVDLSTRGVVQVIR